jgi:hypothetical protein
VGRGLNNEDDPTIEVKDRKTGERQDISTSVIVDHLIALTK